MKRYALLICTLIISMAAKATIYVYSMHGIVQIQRTDKWENIFIGEAVQETDWIKTEEYGKLDLYDDENHAFYSVQSSSPKQVKQIVDQYSTSRTSLPQEFWYGIHAALTGHKEIIDDVWNTRGGGVARGVENLDWQVSKALTYRRDGSSDYAIDFVVLDAQTLRPVTKVAEGQQVIIGVRNKSTTALFVNIMDIMPSGEVSTLYKADSFDAVMELYIPALSNVRLSNHPLTFSPANTTDSLRLVATPMPCSLSNVLDMIHDTDAMKEEKGSDIEIGLYTTTIHITELY